MLQATSRHLCRSCLSFHPSSSLHPLLLLPSSLPTRTTCLHREWIHTTPPLQRGTKHMKPRPKPRETVEPYLPSHQLAISAHAQRQKSALFTRRSSRQGALQPPPPPPSHSSSSSSSRLLLPGQLGTPLNPAPYVQKKEPKRLRSEEVAQMIWSALDGWTSDPSARHALRCFGVGWEGLMGVWEGFERGARAELEVFGVEAPKEEAGTADAEAKAKAVAEDEYKIDAEAEGEQKAEVTMEVPAEVTMEVPALDEPTLPNLSAQAEPPHWNDLLAQQALTPETLTPSQEATSRLWSLPYVIDELLKSPPEEAIRKAIMWRFLSYAADFRPSTPLPESQAALNTPTGAGPAPSPSPSTLALAKQPFAHLADINRLLATLPKEHMMINRGYSSKRRIIMHVGPTNSGKTHQALQALVRADRGLYAGPLRLLAHEIWKRVNTGSIDGISKPCNLLTGEEQRWVTADAGHLACTVEMTPVSVERDVLVLDEIQLIADPDRGPAWMNVLVNSAAREVHVCGEDTAVELVKRIAGEMGDEIEVRRYERLTPLKISDESLEGDLSRVQKGDAIVAFNRTYIFQLAQEVGEKTGLGTALAYGAMPPEVRNQQARMFNDPKSSVGVMVASDAIGLGLNLKIKRIIFHRMTKWNGTEVIELSPSQAKQIAGRAGRFGLHGDDTGGEVTTLYPSDLPILRKAMETPNQPLVRGFIAPAPPTIIEFHGQLAPGTSLADAQAVFAEYTRTAPWQKATTGIVSGLFSDPGSQTGPLYEKFSQLPAQIQLVWMSSPWPKKQIWPLVTAAVEDMLRMYMDKPRLIEIQKLLESHGLYDPFAVIYLGRDMIRQGNVGLAMQRLLSNPRTLVFLESAHRIITFYLWMSYRFPLSFGEQDKAFKLKVQIEDASQIVLAWVASTKKTTALQEVINFQKQADPEEIEFSMQGDEQYQLAKEASKMNPVPIRYDSRGFLTMSNEAGETVPVQIQADW